MIWHVYDNSWSYFYGQVCYDMLWCVMLQLWTLQIGLVNAPKFRRIEMYDFESMKMIMLIWL